MGVNDEHLEMTPGETLHYCARLTAENRVSELEAEVARLTSERDRAVALVRDVAAAYIEWRFDWDIVMPGRLLSAMGACREFVDGEPWRVSDG